VVLRELTPQVAARLLETGLLETEKREHIVIEDHRISTHILAIGMQGPSGTGGSGGTIETYVAGATVNGHRVVVTDEDGEAIHADNTDPTHANAATKISLGAALTGEDVQVQLVGRITEPSWAWTLNGTIYVGADGVLTQTPPAAPAVFSKPVAIAETATRILIVQEPPTMLN
jgi:hypothetical protein